MHDLGTISSPTGGNGQYAYGFGINNSGVVVGESTHTSGSTGYHAFVYDDGKMQDLNKLIPPKSGWTLTTAYSKPEELTCTSVAAPNTASSKCVESPASYNAVSEGWPRHHSPCRVCQGKPG